MARTAYGKHSTQVDTATYPDDPSVPIGSDEWNASPSDSGMLGFNAETIASATSITPSNTVLNISGSTDVATIAQGNTNEYDLLYVFTSGTVTLVHNTGNLKLISGSNKDLSTTIPTILIRKGTDWIEYGGGGNVTGTVMSGHIIPDTNDTYDIGSAEFKIRDLYVSDNSLWVGDNHKVEVAGGKMKFKKRKNNRVPTVITSAGGNEAGAKSNRSRSNLTDMTLNDWVQYGRSLGGSLANAKPNDIFKSEDADDWDTDEASITSEQVSAITANTAKTGITSGQASAITTNTAKVGLSNTAVTDAHLAGSISLSKLANGTVGKIIGFNASTGVVEEQDLPTSGGQIGDFVIATNTTLSEYTEIPNASLTVSSDPANDSVLSGQSVSRTGWGYPSASSMLNVIDGNDSSGATFDMGTGENATCVVDFGSSKTEKIYCVFKANATPTCYLETSTDGSSWTSRATQVVANSSTFYTMAPSSSYTFRYVRLRNTNSSGYAWNHIRTIGIAGYGATNLTDGSSSTNWYSSSESSPNLYFDMEEDLELASIAINLNRTLTTVTNLTIEYSSDSTFSGETVRTLLVSDFTDDTTRYINIPRNQDAKRYCKITGVGTGVLSINYLRYKTEVSDVWLRRHYHTYLDPTSTSSNTLDSN